MVDEVDAQLQVVRLSGYWVGTGPTKRGSISKQTVGKV